MTPKLLAFDWFNTLGDIRMFSTVDERQAYAEQIEENQTNWQPFRLAKRWREMPVFNDVVEGIKRLRDAGFKVVIFSNAPVPLAEAMLAFNGVEVDGVVPLEDYCISKPSRGAYAVLSHWALLGFDLTPPEIAVVTANETFGDLEGAYYEEMGSYLIRGEEYPTLFDLADKLTEVPDGEA